MNMLAEVDVTARVIAIIGAAAGIGKIVWDIIAYLLQGAQKLTAEVQERDDPRAIVVKVTNKGRRPVFIQKAIICYRLRQQELTIDLLKRDRPTLDRRLEPFGDSEEFKWVVSSDEIMQFRLGFQEQPDYVYIALLSQSGEIDRIPNKQVQGVVTHLLNMLVPLPP